jgi:hypothetical protein
MFARLSVARSKKTETFMRVCDIAEILALLAQLAQGLFFATIASMNDLIQRIVLAIFRQEGMPSAWTNPGNLRAAPWRVNPPIVAGFWRPATRAEGIAGAAHCVALRIAEGQSLRELIRAWAPESDGNPTSQYVRNVQDWALIPDVNTPLWTYISRA